MMFVPSSRKILSTVLLTLALVSGCNDPHEISRRVIPVQMGEAEMQVVVYDSGEPGITYLNMHDNEDTAAEAALDVIRRNGGRLIELQHTGERNVAFGLGDTTYVFDPNRMFTPRGLEATLREHGPYSAEARAAASELAAALLEAADVDTARVVITVHNNTQGQYSVLEYMDRGEYQADALFAYYDDATDPDDFFFVTNEQLYSALREAGFNVVLQDNARVTDDGSLSVFAGRRGIPYVNAEAQHGHFEEQVRMLEYLDAHLHEIDLEARPTE